MSEEDFKILKDRLLGIYRSGAYEDCLLLMKDYFEERDGPKAREADKILAGINYLNSRRDYIAQQASTEEERNEKRTEMRDKELDKIWTSRMKYADTLRDFISTLRHFHCLDPEEIKQSPTYIFKQP